MMVTTGDATHWTKPVERVRHGGKLSDALAETAALPTVAVRMLGLGKETGQLPMLAGRVAAFFGAKLQRSRPRGRHCDPGDHNHQRRRRPHRLGDDRIVVGQPNRRMTGRSRMRRGRRV
jgi:hypothetical protein